MINILRDSRDFDFYRKAGQTTALPTNLFFDTNVPDVVQGPGDVRCTCITVCDVATDITGVLYDIDDLFKRIKTDENGANPTDVIKEAIKNGLKRLDNGLYEKPFISYWKAHTGNFDAFDNVRSALERAQRGICIWTPWYDNWGGVVRLPKGNNVTNFHMYEIEGVKEVNGELVLILEAWMGRKLEVTREVFNWMMSLFFSSTAVLSTMEIDVKRKKGYIQGLIDDILNFINTLRVQLAIQQNIEKQPMEPTPQPTDPKLYTVTKSLMGQRLTLDPSVPKDVGCAQCMSYILKEAGYKIPKGGISGTYSLYEWLNKNFYKTDTIEKGNIIISVTGTGNGKIRGHVGVFLDNEVIASNNSKTGLLDTHWKYENWKAYYQQVGKLKTVIFKPKGV